MKHVRFLIALLSMALLFTGCTVNRYMGEKVPPTITKVAVKDIMIEPAARMYDRKVANTEIPVSSAYKKTNDLITHYYTAEEIEEMMQFSGNIVELNEKYPIECVRQGYNNYYYVRYCGEDCVVTFAFDENGNNEDVWKQKVSLPKSAFDELHVGNYGTEVWAIDPKGGYRSGFSFSEHYTADGYYIYLTYENAQIKTIWVGLY